MHANDTELLRRTQAFAQLNDQQLRKLVRSLKERRLERNQVLFRQGDLADSLYVVAGGRMRVSAADRGGRERVLAFVGVGELVGEMGLLSGEPRSATATASTDVRLLQLRKADFDTLAANNVDMMRDLARAVAQRTSTTRQRAANSASDGGYRDGLISGMFSPKGGAGVTTIATNLAVALAQRVPDEVVLLDLHTLYCHVPVLLNVSPRRSLAAISPVSLRQMDRENLEFYLTLHAESSLRILTGVLRPDEGELISADHVKAAIEVLRKQFVHVIIDLGRSFSEANLAAIERCHNLLVVCTPTAPALRGVVECQRIFREVLTLPGDPMQVVVNHCTPYTSVSADDIGAKLQSPLLATIPFGGDQPARAALEGQPMVMRWPNSVTSRAIIGLSERLAQQLMEIRAMASSSPPSALVGNTFD